MFFEISELHRVALELRPPRLPIVISFDNHPNNHPEPKSKSNEELVSSAALRFRTPGVPASVFVLAPRQGVLRDYVQHIHGASGLGQCRGCVRAAGVHARTVGSLTVAGLVPRQGSESSSLGRPSFLAGPRLPRPIGRAQ